MKDQRSLDFGFCLAVLLAAAGFPGQAASPASSGPQERAVSALEQDVKTDPNNAELWLHLGFAYRKLNKIDQAQNAFEKASSLDPHNREALHMLGFIYEKKHLTQDAERIWKQYLALETDAAERDEVEKHIHHLSQ